MSGNIDIVGFGLIKFACNNVLDRRSNIELGLTLDKIVVLDHAEADEVLKMQQKLTTFMHEQFSTLFKVLDELLKFVELSISDLTLHQIIRLRELFNHNLENLTLVHDASKRTVNFVCD